MSVTGSKYQFVVPGEILTTSRTGKWTAGPGVWREKVQDEYRFRASLTGLLNIRGSIVSVVPLEGSYLPREGDVVIGKIIDVAISSWRVDLGPCPNEGFLTVGNVTDRHFDPNRDSIQRILTVGDLILCRIIEFDRTRDPVLSMFGRGLRRITSGRLIEISPVKIPRIIGKKGSMIAMIKNETGSQIYVGQNGRIIIRAPSFDIEKRIVESIHLIARESHVSGLTDRVRLLLSNDSDEIEKKEEKNE